MPLLSLGHGVHKSNQSIFSFSSQNIGEFGAQHGEQKRKKLRPWSHRPQPKGPRGNESKVDLTEQIEAARENITPSPNETQSDVYNEGNSALTNSRLNLIPEPWPCPKPTNLPSITNAPPNYHVPYHLTNKVGPRFYSNYHLRVPDHVAHRTMQSSQAAFSSQFPPIPALPPGSPPLRNLTLGRASIFNFASNDTTPSEGPSNSLSENVSSAPGSSQASVVGSGVNLGSKFASASLAALVDSLDASDPYGQKFHHDSPYDLGNRKRKAPERGMPLNPSSSSSPIEATETPAPSFPAPRRKQVPSPLVQSTSVINIQSDEQFSSALLSETQEQHNSVSTNRGVTAEDNESSKLLSTNESSTLHAPAEMISSRVSPSPSPSPVPRYTSAQLNSLGSQGGQRLTRKLSKSKPPNTSVQSLSSSSQSHLPSPDKTGKRSSILSRFTKRFSFNRRAASQDVGQLQISNLLNKGKEPSQPSGSATSSSSTGTMPSDGPGFLMQKRVPPPPLSHEPSIQPNSDEASSSTHGVDASSPSLTEIPPLSFAQRSDAGIWGVLGDEEVLPMPPSLKADGDTRDSILSMEQGAWHIGKLTIANPDLHNGSETDIFARSEKDGQATPIAAILSPYLEGDVFASLDHVLTSNTSFAGPSLDARASVHSDTTARLPIKGGEAKRHSRVVDTPRASALFNPENQISVDGNSDATPSRTERNHRVSLIENDSRASMSLSTSPPSNRPDSISRQRVEPALPAPPTEGRSVMLENPLVSDTDITSRYDHRDRASSSFGLPPKPVDKDTLRKRLSSQVSSKRPDSTLLFPIPGVASTEQTFDTRNSALRSSTAETLSSSLSQTRPRRESHTYIINVPLDSMHGNDGRSSVSTLEKSPGPLPVPPKSRTLLVDKAMPPIPAPSRSASTKEPTIFTSLFAAPSRTRTSDSSANDSSSHGHTTNPPPSVRKSKHSRTTSYSPEKLPHMGYPRSGSESPDKMRRIEGAAERDNEGNQDRRLHTYGYGTSSRTEQSSRPELTDRGNDHRRDRYDEEMDYRLRKAQRYSYDTEENNRGRNRAAYRDGDKYTERGLEKEGGGERQQNVGRGHEAPRERERKDKGRVRLQEYEEREATTRKKPERETEERKERDKKRESGRRRESEREDHKKEKKRGDEGGEDGRVNEQKHRYENAQGQHTNEVSNRVSGREFDRRLLRDSKKERENEDNSKVHRRSNIHESDNQVARETEQYRLIPRRQVSSTDKDSGRQDQQNVVRLFAAGEDWEMVESSRSKQRGRGQEELAWKNRKMSNLPSLPFPRRNSSSSDESLRPTRRHRRESSSGDRESVTWGHSVGNPTVSFPSRVRASSLEVPHSPTSRPQPGPSGQDQLKVPNNLLSQRDATMRPQARMRSAAQRPISGLPSPAVSQLKAKEAWQRDRMWRGQSMTLDSNLRTTVTPTANWGSSEVFPNGYDSYIQDPYYPPQSIMHGSSYTSFMVQPSWNYPQFESAQEPIEPFSLQRRDNPLPDPPVVSE